MEGLKPMVRIDVSQDNQWTKLAEQQSLDGLLQLQQITLEEFAEMVPDNSSVPKQKLLNVIDKRKAQQQIQQQMTNQIDPQMVYQELINQGMPEEEALAIINQM